MSAVIEQPVQLDIAGVAPAVERLASVCIAGRLNRRALLRISTDGAPHLTVEIRQPGGIPFVVMYHGTHDETAQLEALAMRFGAGTPVIVRGAGLELCAYGDDHVLQLTECRMQPREIRFDDPEEARLL